jgi:RNA polymerase sigma-70 factor (ECF subfamily)
MLAHSRLQPPGLDSPAEDRVIAGETIRSALAGLSEDDREILLLRVWDGFSVSEIAQILSITPGAAAVRLTRAEERFHRQLEPELVS